MSLAMAKPFDAALKELIEKHPADWLAFFGAPATDPVRTIDADVSTVSAATDKLFLVESDPAWLLHVEFQSSPSSGLIERLQWYNTLVRYRHRLPVRSSLVLLRPSADSPQYSGVWQDQLPDGTIYLEFRYQPIRLWQLSQEAVLQGGVGVLPLALLADVPERDLPDVVRRVAERLKHEVPERHEAETLWTQTFVLAGLRLSRSLLDPLFRGASAMSILEDSSALEYFTERAEMRALREVLRNLGEQRFGPPGETVSAALQQLEDPQRLKRMTQRILQVNSWDELLATP
jgi:hypothetical protein